MRKVINIEEHQYIHFRSTDNEQFNNDLTLLNCLQEV